MHTWMRFGVPFTSARTRCTFGFHRRLVRRCEWLSLIPNRGCFPQTSQTDAIRAPGYQERTAPPKRAGSLRL